MSDRRAKWFAALAALGAIAALAGLAIVVIGQRSILDEVRKPAPPVAVSVHTVTLDYTDTEGRACHVSVTSEPWEHASQLMARFEIDLAEMKKHHPERK